MSTDTLSLSVTQGIVHVHFILVERATPDIVHLSVHTRAKRASIGYVDVVVDTDGFDGVVSLGADEQTLRRENTPGETFIHIRNPFGPGQDFRILAERGKNSATIVLFPSRDDQGRIEHPADWHDAD